MSLSPSAAEHVSNPRNIGPLEGATHFGIAYAAWAPVANEGPNIRLWLQIEPVFSAFAIGDSSRISPTSTIIRAAYQANGCPSSIACGSMVAQILTGRTVEQALRLDSNDLMLLLGGLSAGKEYCAEMAVGALHNAIFSQGETS